MGIFTDMDSPIVDDESASVEIYTTRERSSTMDIAGTSGDHSKHYDNIDGPLDLMALTYVPAVPITFGNDDVSASSEDPDAEVAELTWDDEDDYDVASGITVQQYRYNLWPSSDANYNFMA